MAERDQRTGPVLMWSQPSLDHILERVARAICEAEGVDPDLSCPGIGNLIPCHEVWPAWRVRLPQARAAVQALTALECFRVPTRRLRPEGLPWEQMIGGDSNALMATRNNAYGAGLEQAARICEREADLTSNSVTAIALRDAAQRIRKEKTHDQT